MDEDLRPLERAVIASPDDRPARAKLISAYRRIDRFCVDELKDGFVLYNLMYRGGRIDLVWGKKEKSMTLEDARSIYPKAKWHVADLPAYASTLIELYLHFDSPQSQLMRQIAAMFASDFKEWYVRTNSDVLYTRTHEDAVGHQYLWWNWQSVMVNAVVPSATGAPPRWDISAQSPYESLLHGLLQVVDTGLFIDAYRAITGAQLRLIINRSAEEGRRTGAVVLGGGAPKSGGHDLNCWDDPLNQRPARLVRRYDPKTDGV